MVKAFVIFLLAVTVPQHGHPENSVGIEDAYLTVPEIIQKNGYPFEDHSATTDDGYVLHIHRIPHGKNGTSDPGRVVFVMHGLLCSSAVWIIAGPGRALAYILADVGYDVWLGNARGNTYSREHIRYDPYKDSKEFWNFSWHEGGIYDLPAMIDYTLEETNQSSLFYIGTSQGTTTFYVMASERPEYNEKIKLQFSLGPVAYMGNLRSPVVKSMARFKRFIERILKAFAVDEFMPNNGILSKLSAISCDNKIGLLICPSMLFLVFGFDRDQLNTSLLPTIMGHLPAGSSTKQMLHYGQEVISGEFRQFDLETDDNRKAYDNEIPPNYQLERITSPVYLFYSKNDWVCAEKDVKRLAEQLPNLKELILVDNDKWNHMDYMFGIDAKTLVYDEIISLIEKWED